MTPPREDIHARKDRILCIAIEEYIRTITPVSSACIVQWHSLDLSSATIRNILAQLEEEGYLTHPHTSAGRIPTPQGYRYYVDNFLNEIRLLEAEKIQIVQEYAYHKVELEQLLEKTTQIISDLTNYTSIVSVDGWTKKFLYRGAGNIVEYLDPYDMGKIKAIWRALEEKGQLLEVINQELERKIQIFIDHEINCQDIHGCSLVVSRYCTKRGPKGRMAVLGPTRMNYERVVSTLDYLSNMIEQMF